MSMSLGSQIDELYELKQRAKDIRQELKTVEDGISDLEGQILANLDEQNMQLARGSRATVSVSEKEHPNVEDWDAVFEYIKTNDMMHLLTRKLASAAWRELHEAGETVPGTRAFKQRSLSVTKVKTA